MVEFLVSWAEQLLVALIIIIVLEMILPENSTYRKYIKTVLGVFLIYCIISPLVSNKIKDISFNGLIENKKIISNQVTVIENDKQIEETFKVKFKSNINEYLNEKGYEIVDINQDLEYKNKEIVIHSIDLKIRKINKDTNIKVKKVQIGKSSKIENSELEELKGQISDYYEIDKSKIKILESEK